RLTQVTDEAGSESREYGALGELPKSIRTVVPLKPGDSTLSFITQFAFDSFGRMLSIAYPDGESVSYGYDAGGLLASAGGLRTDGQKETYLQALSYDEFGQRIHMELGNKVTSDYFYEADTRRLHRLDTQ